jgi:Gpi18-like mannosyltransferase
MALIVLLVVGLGLRLAALPLPGHFGDVSVMARWAENLVLHGPGQFYEHDSSIYPALLPFLWIVGLAFDGDQLTTAIKGISIPFDLLIGLTLYAVVARRAGSRAGLLAAGCCLLNPALILAGPVWGQVDAAGSLFFLLALMALAADRFGWAGALAIVAGLAKPQFGLVALPVLVVVGQRLWQRRDARPLAAVVAGGAVAGGAVGAFLGLSPFRWAERLSGTATFQPDTSLNAINVWGVLVGFEIDDAPYVGIGALLLVIGLVASVVPLRRGHDLSIVLTVGMMLAFAFYFLPTRVHERYLFPAFAVAAPLAAVDVRSLAAYVSLSIGFTGTLLRALVLTTPFTLTSELQSILTAPWMVWVLAILLFGSAATLIRLSLTGAGDALRPARSPQSAESLDPASAAPG